MKKNTLGMVVVLLISTGLLMGAEDSSPQAPPDSCAALDDPEARGAMSAMMETKLLLECGRADELGPAAARAPAGPGISAERAYEMALASAAADVLVNYPAGDAGGVSHTQSETSLAVNENNGTVCSCYNDSYHGVVQGTGYSGFSSSTDGGASFVDHGAHTPGAGGVSYGDPSVVWRKADGLFYYAGMCVSGLCLWKSTDDCTSFAYLSTIHAGGNDDKEMMAVDNDPSSPYYGRLYVAWTDFNSWRIFLTYSDSGIGGSWSAPLALSAVSAKVQGAWPAVAQGGDLYVAWLRWATYPTGPLSVEVVRSTNGGASFVSVTNPLSDGTVPRDAASTSYCGRNALNGHIRYAPFPQLAVGPDGVLHVVYAYDPDGSGIGDVSDVFYRRSTDNGATWGTEVKLNDDGTTRDQFFPSLSVGRSNVVVTAWYDRRNDPANLLFDYYERTSRNGGLTWQASSRVSDVSSPVYIDPYLATCYHGDYDQQKQYEGYAYINWSDDRNWQDGHYDPDVWFEKLRVVPTVQPIFELLLQ